MPENPVPPHPNESLATARTLGWLTMGLLFLASIYLAANRILQVDEAQQVFQSALPRPAASTASSIPMRRSTIWVPWPGSRATRAMRIPSSLGERFLFLLVFWSNILLLARICAGSWQSARILPWLLMAATLVPLWDYGFEVRHDNLLLTGLLSFWFLGPARAGAPLARLRGHGCPRRHPPVRRVQVVPLLAAMGRGAGRPPPHPSCRHLGRPRLAFALLAGAGVGLLAARVSYALGGGWHEALAGFLGGVGTSVAAPRFSPLPTLLRLVAQVPLVSALALAFAVAQGARWRREGRAYLGWNTEFPELALLASVLCIFLANPTPFPYNLLFVLPFLLVAAAAFWRGGFTGNRPVAATALLAGVLAFCHGLPFLQLTARHLDRTNDRQMTLMHLAETMTDPAKDRVFDGTGLVPTRKTIGYHWQIHTFTIGDLSNGKFPPVRAMLAQNPASVILPSYRTDWLPKEDKEFISNHYVPLADDFLVLGTVLPAGGGSWSCLHPGRYQIQLPDSVSGAQTILVDGRTFKVPGALDLSRGDHVLQGPAPSRILAVWIGPRLNGLPSLSPGNHLNLFVNWY